MKEFCDFCFEEYETYPSKIQRSDSHFCSKLCGVSSFGDNVGMALCSNCGLLFVSRSPGINKEKFCRQECYFDFKKTLAERSRLLKEKNKKEKIVRKVECYWCKELFVRNKTKRSSKEFCSKKCFYDYLNSKKVKRTCKQCGKELIRSISLFSGKNVFCSSRCKNLFRTTRVSVSCLNCGAMVERNPAELNESGIYFCGNSCQKEYFIGENHPCWLSDRSALKKGELLGERTSAKYKTWREDVFRRDGYVCKFCGKTGMLNAHHIKKFSIFEPGRYAVDNGITLCADCHYATYSCEEEYEELFYDILKENIA